MKKYLTLCVILSLSLFANIVFAKVQPAHSQTTTSSLPIDEHAIQVRQMDKSKLSKFRGDKDFSYTHKTPKVAEKEKVKENIQLPLKKTPNIDLEPMWNTFVICIVVLCIFLIMWGMFGRQIAQIFRKSSTPLSSDEGMMEQDIKLADFDTLISNAVKENEYRKAVRMLYLEALKVLTINQWILWKPNKTNQDYLNELQLSPFKKAFSDLTLQFEYIWYGDFPVNDEVFQQTRNTFQDFKSNVKSKVR
jgi:hypothetical protein